MTSTQRAFLIPVLCGGAMMALAMGVRQSLALFIGPINTSTGLGLAAISFAFGFGQLMWGVTQPIGGAIADRHGNAPVLILAALMIGTGTALLPFAHSQWALLLSIGVLGAGGAGLAGPSMIMSAVGRLIPIERRGMAHGLVNAGGSFGQFAILPFAQAMSSSFGWASALFAMSALSLLIIPASFKLWLPGTSAANATGAATKAAPVTTMRKAVDTALHDSSFLMLAAGFFVCGFHVAFIATHLPGVIASCGLPPEVGAWSLAVIGLFNLAGSIGIGWAMGRWRSKYLLSMLYAVRGLAVLVFLLAPKTELTFLLFAAVIGLTYLSTVPPTAGLVAKFYGMQYMATLFGLVMLTHQVGGFFGAWLGGKAFERSQSYDWMWYADIALAVAAALIHLPIREERVVRAMPAAA